MSVVYVPYLFLLSQMINVKKIAVLNPITFVNNTLESARGFETYDFQYAAKQLFSIDRITTCVKEYLVSFSFRAQRFISPRHDLSS